MIYYRHISYVNMRTDHCHCACPISFALFHIKGNPIPLRTASIKDSNMEKHKTNVPCYSVWVFWYFYFFAFKFWFNTVIT
jgi:hypothetical protein